MFEVYDMNTYKYGLDKILTKLVMYNLTLWGIYHIGVIHKYAILSVSD